MFGTSKKRMKPIMTDVLHKVENYKEQREKTKYSKAGNGWHKIVLADSEATTWRKKSCTVGGNRCQTVGLVGGGGAAGYINKNGFNTHT